MAELAECPITYEELTDIEHEFENVELDMLRQQYALNKPMFEKREKVVAQVPSFWALVMEQAPAEVDQYVRPSDSAVLLSSLKNISVTRFECENGAKGDPRSVAIKFEFDENDYFEDRVLEKKFWQRTAKEGWSGLVSEPVAIKWKAGKDLTDGMLDLVCKVWEHEKTHPEAANATSKAKKEADYTADEKVLKEKIDKNGLGGGSFFGFFGYRGFNVTEAESKEAVAKENEERAKRVADGYKAVKEDKDKMDEDEEEDDDEDDDPLALEIFPDGDELAVAIAEDLHPGAIKYFLQGQEAAELSELDFEEMDDDEDDDEDDEMEDDDKPAGKKRKA